MGKRNHRLLLTTYSLKGVTLIELLIVITVVGILAAALLTAINPVKQLQRGRDTKRKADIAKIQQALELYRSDANLYPTDGELSNCGGTNKLIFNNITYLNSIPCDPTTTQAYKYTRSTNTSYSIFACLENTDEVSNGPDCTSGITYKQFNP